MFVKRFYSSGQFFRLAVSTYPLSPDGGGTALQIINVALNLNAAASWIESCPGGSPGMPFEMPCANAVDDLIVEGEIIVFPNPATNIIQLAIPLQMSGNAMVSVYDLAGRELITKKFALPGNTSINIDALPVGIYHLQMQLNGQRFGTEFFKE